MRRAPRVKSTLLLVKEPNGSQSADVIMRAQPTARLLFLLRDGRDVVDSELASFAVGGWQERAFRAHAGRWRGRAPRLRRSLGVPMALADRGGPGGVRGASRPEAHAPLRGPARRYRSVTSASSSNGSGVPLEPAEVADRSSDRLAFERLRSPRRRRVQPLREPGRLAREPAPGGARRGRRASSAPSSASSATTSSVARTG